MGCQTYPKINFNPPLKSDTGEYLRRHKKFRVHLMISKLVSAFSRQVFYKKIVLKNFAKFIAKHLVGVFFWIKLLTEVCNFIKKETQTLVFPCEVCKIFNNNFYRTPSVATKILHLSTFTGHCYKSTKTNEHDLF